MRKRSQPHHTQSKSRAKRSFEHDEKSHISPAPSYQDMATDSNLFVLTGQLTSPSCYCCRDGQGQYRFDLAHQQTKGAPPLRITMYCFQPHLHRIACQLQQGDFVTLTGTLQYQISPGMLPSFQLLAHHIHQQPISISIQPAQ